MPDIDSKSFCLLQRLSLVLKERKHLLVRISIPLHCAYVSTSVPKQNAVKKGRLYEKEDVELYLTSAKKAPEMLLWFDWGDPKMRKGLLFAQRTPFREKEFYFCEKDFYYD